jgi:hypothetical protein
MKCGATLLLALVAPILLAATPTQTVRPSGIYSTLRYIAEAGDLIGVEIMVVPQGESWGAVVQVSEGGSPYVAFVALTKVGDHFEFSLPADGAYPDIHCEIRFLATEAQLSGSSCLDEHHLKRKKSYWE